MVIVVFILFLVCLFPDQLWIAHLLPGISGLATINLSLIIFDIPTPLPVAVDLILAPALFILLYIVVILIYASRRGMSIGQEIVQRLGAVLWGLFILLVCVAVGGLISYFIQDYLPERIRNGIDSFGINTDIHLPYAGYKAVHLHGNIIVLVCFMIGIALYIKRINKAPGKRKTAQLTREQRMTPYQRMLQEKRQQEKEKKEISRQPERIPRQSGISSSSLCHNQPLRTIQPEAVNYRPLV